MHFVTHLLFILPMLLLVSSDYSTLVSEYKNSTCYEPYCEKVAKRILDSLDKTVDPCENFYQYACGGWIEKHHIPKNKEEYSAIVELSEEVDKALKQILPNITSGDSETIKKVKNFYKSCIDTAKINSLGAKPIQKFLKKIGSWNVNAEWDANKWNFLETLRQLHREYPAEIFFTVDVDVDPKNRTQNIITIDQAKLSLPQISYFTNRPALDVLVEYATRIAALTEGLKDPKDDENLYRSIRKKMRKVVLFEMKLAKISVPKQAKRYARTSIDRLEKAIPEFPWLKHLESVLTPRTITPDDHIVVLSNDYLADLVKEINETEPSVLSNYMAWRMVKDMVPFLSEDFTNAYNKFRSELTGSTIIKSREDICYKYTDEILGPLMGALFIRNKFSPEDKSEVEEMMHLIIKAFERNAETVDWISQQTIKSVKEKAEAAVIKVGYPDYLYNETQFKKRYEEIEIQPNTFFDNVASIDKFSNRRTFKKLDNPVDPHQWVSVPHMANAFYVVTKNEIVIPAGILQPPFFYGEPIPRSISYGAIGHVLGHELTHGFDTLGRRFNKQGELIQKRTKWSELSIKKFENRTKCLLKQFNRYKVGDKLHIDGKNTLGENIADGGGVKMAYMAYKTWVEEHGEEYVLPYLNKTNMQLFFIGYAQKECHRSTAKAIEDAIKDDVHAPSMFRIIGTLSNSEHFAKAFNCKANATMNPAEKCEVW
ncbi:endothelin-converting enzyme 2 isoform X2 [Hydra vulgaris]|uniref:Endothelin-converting enzyme 2 isoform X2 n=1 Tax=Hydra vulgaris TaxID=6087 RepID=A0ABM4B8L2_HYDVU